MTAKEAQCGSAVSAARSTWAITSNDREAILERLEKTCRILDGFIFAKSEKKTENEKHREILTVVKSVRNKNQGKHDMIHNE